MTKALEKIKQLIAVGDGAVLLADKLQALAELVSEYEQLVETCERMRDILASLPQPRKNGNPDYVAWVGDDLLLKARKALQETEQGE